MEPGGGCSGIQCNAALAWDPLREAGGIDGGSASAPPRVPRPPQPGVRGVHSWIERGDHRLVVTDIQRGAMQHSAEVHRFCCAWDPKEEDPAPLTVSVALFLVLVGERCPIRGAWLQRPTQGCVQLCQDIQQ